MLSAIDASKAKSRWGMLTETRFWKRSNRWLARPSACWLWPRKADATLGDAERDMTFLGLVGMIDPPRPEAKAAVERCEQAGIRVVMITGDHPLTAQAVARELGLFKTGRAITGAELEDMSDEELERDVETIEVYSRVSPAHKLRVVTALQKRGHIAAMTGDGVNDAPALKKADIGIAMGITGTDVSKEAAAMTLTDDNFASIVAAVEEGRGIFENIKKYLMYLLSSNIGEIGLMAGATIAGLPLPLTAVQILYVNLATDGLPALALAVDPPEDDLMQRRTAQRAHRSIHSPRRDADDDRRAVVHSSESRPLHLGPAVGPRRCSGHDDDLRVAGVDPVLQGLQLPLRPPVHLASAVRQQVAEPRHLLGAGAVAIHRALSAAARAVRHLRVVTERLADRRRRIPDHFAGPGAGQVVRTARLVRKAVLTVRWAKACGGSARSVASSGAKWTWTVAEPPDCGTASPMDKTAPIADFMTSMPHTVGSEQTITFAQKLMQKHGVRHLPVLHGGELHGIVSDRDLGMVAGLNEVNPDATTVEEAMTQEAYTVSKDTPLFSVLNEMLEHKYGSAVVVEGNKIIGILTTHDALELLVEKFPTA